MLQPGPGYNLTTANGVSTLDVPSDWQLPSEPDQFQVSVFKTSTGWGVRCRKGFVRYTSQRKGDMAFGVWQAEVRKFWCFPDGTKTVGDAATSDDSSLVDLGGYVQIQPASVEGGSDTWGVYIIGCGDAMSGFVPYLAIMAQGSDADLKTEFFNGNDPQIVIYNMMTQEIVTVEQPGGSSTSLTLFNPNGGFAPYNYNCQKWKLADIHWESGVFVVRQKHLGSLCLPNPTNYGGMYLYDGASPPAWLATPNYSTEQADWEGAWTGYTKNIADATVTV